MKVGRGLVIASIGAMIVLSGATPASAHAGVVSSTPDEGATLSTAPGVVTLRYSEPIDAELSNASVSTPDGDEVGGMVTAEEEIQVALATNATGVYRVEWTTVSLVDGHTLTGSFGFGVSVDPGTDAEGATATEPRGGDLVVAVFRWIEDLALLLAIGLLLLGRLSRRTPPIAWVRTPLRLTLGTALVAGVIVIVGEGVIASGGFSPDRVATYLSNGAPGSLRMLRVGMELAAFLAAIWSPRAVPFLLFTAVFALGAAGHAAAISPRWWGMMVETLHLVSAGMWAGGVAAIAMQRPPDGWRGEQARVFLDRFTPVALPAFAVTVLTGGMRGIQEIGGFSALFGSAYGIVLLVKVLLVLTMVQLSIFAWRRIVIRPRLEALVVVFVVAGAALLSAFPLPPARVAEAEGARASQEGESALPKTEELSLGGRAGEHLVGLTVDASADRLDIFVLSLGGPEDNATTVVNVELNGQSLPVSQCGTTCRRVEATILGGEKVSVSVEGGGGGTAEFVMPDPGAPAADELLGEVMARMQALRSFRLVETLDTGRTSIVSTYLEQAPDELSVTARFADGTRSETIWVGDRRFLRKLPGGTWRQDTGASISVPTFTWDSFEPFLGTRLLGSDKVAGERTRVISFFGGDEQLPAWFRLWVDEHLRVVRASMSAPGHFMEQRYGSFDEDLSIEPPDL